MDHGEFRKMLTGELYRKMDAVLNEFGHLQKPYYIQVRINPDYHGPAMGSMQKGVSLKDVETGGKKVIHTRLIVFQCVRECTGDPLNCGPGCKAFMGHNENGRVICPLTVPQLGTMLWKVDNKRGQIELVSALPADRPHTTEDSDNAGDVAVLAAESARQAGVPLMWN